MGVPAARCPGGGRLRLLPLGLLLGGAGSGPAGRDCPVYRRLRPQEPAPGVGYGQRHPAHGPDPGGPRRQGGDPRVPASGRQPGPGGRPGRDDPGPADPPWAPLVVQVSRWDRLKDPLGVLEGFARHVPDALGAHLLLAGPATVSVSDPEADQVLQQVRRIGAALPRAARDRVIWPVCPWRTWRRMRPWSTPSSAGPM
jgi:hypothetical protein